LLQVLGTIAVSLICRDLEYLSVTEVSQNASGSKEKHKKQNIIFISNLHSIRENAIFLYIIIIIIILLIIRVIKIKFEIYDWSH
jgi:t-SNARE complex subunit (syntaxin)